MKVNPPMTRRRLPRERIKLAGGNSLVALAARATRQYPSNAKACLSRPSRAAHVQPVDLGADAGVRTIFAYDIPMVTEAGSR
jgi:hypothetical protein